MTPIEYNHQGGGGYLDEDDDEGRQVGDLEPLQERVLVGLVLLLFDAVELVQQVEDRHLVVGVCITITTLTNTHEGTGITGSMYYIRCNLL